MEDLASPGQPEPVGVFVAAPVLPEVHDRIAAPGGPWLLDGIADAAESGDGFPDDEAMARANAGDGIDFVVCWIGYGEATRPPEVAARLRGHLVAAFQGTVSGNRVRRFTLETEDAEVARRFATYGLETLREDGDAKVMSLHRDAGLASSDLSNQRFFAYDPPVLGYSPAQRAILRLARQGYTDQEIAATLGKTTDSVKKRWAGIYARFAASFPGRLPEGRDGSRGQEKRRTLLAYLKDRPEELRPYGAADGA